MEKKEKIIVIRFLKMPLTMFTLQNSKDNAQFSTVSGVPNTAGTR